ncbi:efflux RND transporter periplasmic adaptor subunit [Photobacterium lutimaris]|uniref:Efflux transporter periplasmic adaptor subunit n=1 Tax=Photobacterium lutimaris TaxID=388278 RepID=A0A2T3IVU1_9GAMM|nr:efflux RND transporter periplasmic adaptor subunit [Photobacterium lutimaris]PSU32539.1 efflux transporter periplasmic adaptor subunit [Photobacterium lutimaris]TDR77749.1 Cu(I)/Ag(I) efflux system membrane fusion protein [Photobacterium lutimaris]
MKQSFSVAFIALAIGAGLGYFTNAYFANGQLSTSHGTSSHVANNEPLYWVAPMDPNYKRDKPGKSPMGMDLIPVYEEDLAGGNDDPAGTVTINPAVENNLGVKTTRVERQQLAPKIDSVGYVSFDESQLWQINSRVSGWIQNLSVNAIGERVVAGQVLFEIYSPDLVRAQEELLNAKRMGKAVLVKGTKDRLRSLGVDNGQISDILRRGKARQYIAIKAPADGVIASLDIRNGAYLSPQQTVITGGGLSDVWVDAEVFERQAHWITPGTTAEMSVDALPGKSWQGKVDYIYPILDPATRTLRVRLKFSNRAANLKPNMFANLTLIPHTKESVLVVPEQAVIRSGNMARVVLSLSEGKYRSARIETGRTAAGMVEVIDGLTTGDSVVTSAHFMLDSESSQSADLSRINTNIPAEPVNQVHTSGVIRNIMLNHKMLTLEHPPIPEWGWPAMTMDFTVGDDSDLSQFVGGQSVRFLVTKQENGQYTLSDVKAESGQSGAKTDHSTMDHSTMDHSTMDHSLQAPVNKEAKQ